MADIPDFEQWIGRADKLKPVHSAARLRAAPSLLRAAWMALEDSIWGDLLGAISLFASGVLLLFILWGYQ